MTLRTLPQAALMLFLTCTAFASQVDMTCTGKTSDTAALNTAITSSNPGDQIRIHGNCLINEPLWCWATARTLGIRGQAR